MSSSSPNPNSSLYNKNRNNTDNINNSSDDIENEQKEELYNMYQQIVVLMKDIINIIELNKVDENNKINDNFENEEEDGDNELQKILCFIWDITCQEENSKLVVNCIDSSISIFLKLMTITKLERTQELCLGILGNIACFESLYYSLYENEILINIDDNNIIMKEKEKENENKNTEEIEMEKMNLKLKKAQYHLDIYKSIADYLLNFVLNNLQYLNYEERKKNKDIEINKIEEEEENSNSDNDNNDNKDDNKDNNEKNNVNKKFLQPKIFFDISESKTETIVSLLRIVYTLFRNNHFLMIDDTIQQKIVETLLEWIYLYTINNINEDEIEKNIEDIENGKENINNNNNNNNNNYEEAFLLDGINLSFKIIECFIQNHLYDSFLLQELFFNPNHKNYKVEIIILCLLHKCIPSETGWKILYWMIKEIQKIMTDFDSNIKNLKNNNTKLIIQSLLLNNSDALPQEGLNIQHPNLESQTGIKKKINPIIFNIIKYCKCCVKGIEQDAEETYGDIKQKVIQKWLYEFFTILMKRNHNNIKNNKLIKWCKDIIYDEDVEMDYMIKAQQLEALVHNTCCSILTLSDTFKIINSNNNDDDDKDWNFNYYECCKPIFNLLCQLWQEDSY
ncbi:hypothetical protein BCR32DRAFT_272417 [Anaeromyces robustus]|uniref:Uncharacterized protein n=1 Tax=Anaeromyces robustus TaxID=1754192 RepID=A0A1Y1W8J9_9FUNG|nr:hypothetical protein BCR32DRAFT_272417 [Anaeromyces robustus]|eukprot:ORX69833.1 hypothetical protein BCR32DRAFT_272417 [Anaeromyces robustus]